MIGSRFVMAVLGRPFCTASLTCRHKSSRGAALNERWVDTISARAKRQSARFILQVRRQPMLFAPAGIVEDLKFTQFTLYDTGRWTFLDEKEEFVPRLLMWVASSCSRGD